MFKEFTIEQVFTVKKVYGRPQKTYEIGDTAYVTGAKNNNGVVGFVKADDKSISKGNCISVDPITGMSCYQPVDFVGRGFSGASINLLYNDNLNEKTALFMCSVIEKAASSVAAYTNLFNSTRLTTAKISLPVIESSDPYHEYTVDDIDWQYMQDRIAELEQDRIAELDAYLVASGLDDYELTDEDEEVLALFPCSKEFKVADLFRIVNPKGKLSTRELLDGSDISYVAAKKTNNGVAKVCSRANIPDEQVMRGNCIVFVRQGDGAAGYTTYQPDDFYAIPCVCAGYIDGHLNEQIGTYLVTLLDKNRPLYGHSNSWSGDKLYNTVMSLPVIPYADPDHVYTVDDIDWKYMERYIRAIEKLSIADVVEYKNQVIATTKQVVTQ